MSKNNTLLDTIFHWIFIALASENESKIKLFSYLCRKCRFNKIHCFSWRKWLFFWFRASKNRPKFDVKTYSKITSKKEPRKSNFWVHFGLQNPRKSVPKAMLNEACFATRCNPPGSRRKLTEAIAFGLSKRLRIWLGLLYWSAPRRPNHQSKVCNLTCSTHISAHATRESKNIVQRH